MNLMNSLSIKKCIWILIGLIFLTDLAILLDIPYIRQILGFLFLTFLPGLLILQILKSNKIEFTEKFVLTVGLGISFLMFFGLLLNNLSLGFGYKSPLSTVPLLISFNLATVALTFIAYRMNKNVVFSLPNLNLTTSEKAFLIVPVIFPALSIFGVYFMNTTNNNTILIFFLFLIPIYVTFVCFLNKKFPARIYPLILFLISISLIIMLQLRSSHILGTDMHMEFYYFQTTFDNAYWSVFGHTTFDACLSISLLPTVYQSISNIEPEYFYKFFYVILFSLLPLIMFIISKKYIGYFYGFLASVFFMFQARFVFSGGRTNVAIFFFALAMMVLFSDIIDPQKKRILFIVFMASCMVSHYSTTYIFFFILLGTFVGVEILSKKYSVKKIISLTIVILFFSMIFFWYSQVTETAFNAGIGFVGTTFKNLHEFFILESRGTGEALLGKDIMEKGIPHMVEFVFTWLTFALIGIGIITLIRRYKEMSFPELNLKKSGFLKDKFEVAYFVIALACVGLLVVMIALPFVAVGYDMFRLYGVAITILSVFFVIGGIIVAKYLNKLLAVLQGKASTNNASQVRAYLIILLVLIPYFFCVTGVMYNTFGVPRQIILNSEGRLYDALYVHDQESYGAKWLKNCMDQQNKIAVDYFGPNIFMSQTISKGLTDSGALFKHKEIEGYIYLRYVNVVNGKLWERGGQWHNLTDYSEVFIGKGKIYDNGGSEVYK